VSADEKITTHLKKFRADYIKSIMDKNPQLIGGYYAETIRLMPEFQKTVMGKSNALSYHKAFSEQFETQEYDRNEIEILDLGSKVVELGIFTLKTKVKNSIEQHTIEGKYLNVWEKGKNGKLSLITEAWNYNHLLSIEEKMRFEQVPTVNIALAAHVPINSSISFELAALNRLAEVTIAQHDAKIWSQFYSDDAMLLYSRSPIYKGKKAISEFHEKHVKEIPVFEKLDIRTDRIDDLGNYVIEYASHIAIIRDGEYSGVGTGKNIAVWRREKGGALKIFRSIAMYD
jgi:ketosteroid isomerase-like protein